MNTSCANHCRGARISATGHYSIHMVDLRLRCSEWRPWRCPVVGALMLSRLRAYNSGSRRTPEHDAPFRRFLTISLSIATFAIDVIAVIAALTAVAVLTGFSASFHVGRFSVSVTSAHNPLLILAILVVFRSLTPSIRVFRAINISALPARALVGWCHVHDRVRDLPREDALRTTVFLAAVSLAMKLSLAYAHPGFWTGDDVEIHEMTFARLFGFHWQAWNLRSPFYPMAVIYPVQGLLVHGGLSNTHALVFSGRAIVATCSAATLVVLFAVCWRTFGSVPIALISVLILATNKLHTMTGTTELPRPVSALLVLAAFAAVSQSRRITTSFVAGALVGTAAAMRFSEEIFAAPAVLQLSLERRWVEILAFGCGFAAIALFVLGPVDQLYWGESFFSLRHMVDFTLVQRLSTRGYQPWYEYIRAVPEWTNVGVAAAAITGAVLLRRHALVLWTVIPVATLSALPHKEPRYLVPVLPYFAMLAGYSVWQLIIWLRHPHESDANDRRISVAGTLTAAVIAIVLTEPTGYVLPRTDDAVACARYIARVGPRDGVAAAQLWNIGGRIYLPLAEPLIDLDPIRMATPDQFGAAIGMASVKWIVLPDRVARRSDYERTLVIAGFDAIVTPFSPRSTYRLYRRR